MPRTGGRQKGTLNKKTVERLKAAATVKPDKGKHGGRQKGSRNKATTEREAKMSDAIRRVLRGLSRKAIDAMTPRDVMQLVMTLGLKIGDLKLAYMAASDLAPYCHAKLTAVAVGDSDAQGFGKLLETLERRRQRLQP